MIQLIRRTPFGRRQLATLALSSCSLIASAAFAQTADTAQTAAAPQAAASETADISDIVVTARFRNESVQTTPLAITALSGDQLTARGASRIEDIGASTPSVTLQQNSGGSGKAILAFIRGVGQFDFISAFEPGVGMYVDDVYHGTLLGGLFELTDTGQVEVLRGPQGILFGKNNEGGAIRISSTRPRGDGTGFFEAGLGSFNRVQVKGAFDFGLIEDVLALRVSGGMNSYDGFVKVIDFVCARPAEAGTLPRQAPNRADGSCEVGRNGGSDVKSVKANLLFTPNEALEINVIADLTDDKGTPTGEKLLAVNTNPPSSLGGFGPVPGFGTASATGYGIPYDSRFITPDFYSTYATYSDERGDVSFPRVNNMRSWGIMGKINWKISPNLTLTSITGYRSYKGEFTEIWGNAPIHIDDNYFRPYHRQFSQELRLNGVLAGGALEWTLGGYHYDAYTEANDFIYLPEVTILNALVPSATKPGLAFYGVDPVKDRDNSAFAHVLFHATDKLNIEAGVRYSDIVKIYTFHRFVPEGFADYPIIAGFENLPPQRSPTSRLDYRAAVQYQWTPDIMTYATYATGFKGPGVNPRPTSAAEVLPFKEEKLQSYEVGIKTKLFDNRVRFNVSAYRSDYKDLQLITVKPGFPGGIVSNAGKARIYGVEVETQAEPVDGLVIDGSLGYIHFRYLDLGDAEGLAGAPCLDCKAQYVPDWQAAVGIQYRASLGKLGTLTPRLDWAYRSKTYNDLFNSEIASTAGYSLFNGRLAYETEDKHWGASLEVKNIADKKYFLNKFNQLSGAGVLVGTLGMPRTFLFSVRYNFNAN